MADNLEGEELISGLKQLVSSFEPYILEASSVDEAEEMLLHLEENDENFHRYNFVRSLRSQIDSVLGNLIEEEIERHSMIPTEPSAGQETLVTQITDLVLNSRQYKDLNQKLKDDVKVAVEHLRQNFETEFCLDKEAGARHGTQRHKANILFSDGESSFDDSSLNQSTVMFMNNEQFQRLADNLDKRKPLETRRDALKSLLQITTMDVQSCEAWSSIRQGILDALGDSDDQLWAKSLKFVARCLSANTPCTRDLYSTVAEYLRMQFQSITKNNIPRMKNGLDCKRPDSIQLLKLFRLLNEFQQHVPQYWIRYPEKFVEEVLHSTLGLLAIQQGTSLGSLAPLTPLHYLALVDPTANWFTMWMHGHYSRAPLLKLLVKYVAVVENAVKSCLDYVEARKVDALTMAPAIDAKPNPENAGRTAYSGPELEFVYFVHSMHFVSRLLCYKQGHKLFPLAVCDREPVTLTKLLVTLIELITEQRPSKDRKDRLAQEFDPCKLVTDMLSRLCASETLCVTCVCKDEVTRALLRPITRWLPAHQHESSGPQPADSILLHVAEILSQVASSNAGRHHMLYGESGGQFIKNKSSAVHVLAEFSQRALTGKLASDTGRVPSQAVVGNMVFVCRQLYGSCEGLLVMYPYDLHGAIASVWKEASREADRASTPTPSTSDGRDNSNLLLWEDTLRDNLLSLAATPKGVLLLQQAGAMTECVAYMSARHAGKHQVSKCEKFGYGFMLSQVACTAVGMEALQKTGFVRSLIRGLWGSLEVVDDKPIHTPKSWPVYPIEKPTRKAFLTLVTLLSSYPAVLEVLGSQKLPTKDAYSLRELPDSIPGLFDRWVLVNTDAKINSLFNYEQSHVFGLRLLSAMTSCLDSLLLLQSQYSFQEILLQAQRENVTETSQEIIQDMLSLERNYILVKTYLVGGPSERTLPPRDIEGQDVSFHFPLFSSYPVPDKFTHQMKKPSGKQDGELSKFLSETKKAPPGAQWVDRCRRVFCSALGAKPEQVGGQVLQDLLDRAVGMLADIPEEAIFPAAQFASSDSVVKSFKLTAEQKLGIDMAVRYGSHLKLMTSGCGDKLTSLLKKTTLYLKQQQTPITSSDLHSHAGSAVGFDWFVATMFILMGGSADKTWKLLLKLSTLTASAYLWPQRMHCTVHLPQTVTLAAIPPLFSATCHQVEFILQTEVEHVFSAFKMSGFAPAQICQQWLRQCFWNFLDWEDICQYVAVCLVMGVDYQVYLCVAILRHLQRDILQHMQDRNLIVFLKEQPLRGFKVSQHVAYMQELEKKYRHAVLQEMVLQAKP